MQEEKFSESGLTSKVESHCKKQSAEQRQGAPVTFVVFLESLRAQVSDFSSTSGSSRMHSH